MKSPTFVIYSLSGMLVIMAINVVYMFLMKYGESQGIEVYIRIYIYVECRDVKAAEALPLVGSDSYSYLYYIFKSESGSAGSGTKPAASTSLVE